MAIPCWRLAKVLVMVMMTMMMAVLKVMQQAVAGWPRKFDATNRQVVLLLSPGRVTNGNYECHDMN